MARGKGGRGEEVGRGGGFLNFLHKMFSLFLSVILKVMNVHFHFIFFSFGAYLVPLCK